MEPPSKDPISPNDGDAPIYNPQGVMQVVNHESEQNEVNLDILPLPLPETALGKPSIKKLKCVEIFHIFFSPPPSALVENFLTINFF